MTPLIPVSSSDLADRGLLGCFAFLDVSLGAATRSNLPLRSSRAMSAPRGTSPPRVHDQSARTEFVYLPKPAAATVRLGAFLRGPPLRRDDEPGTWHDRIRPLGTLAVRDTDQDAEHTRGRE